MSTFDEDYKRGRKVEETILNAIKNKYPEAYIQEGYFKDWDIFIPELKFGIEVKYDIESIQTGNYLIETKDNGKPSGLTTSKAKYWVIYDGDSYLWLLTENIKKCIADNNLKKITYSPKEDKKTKEGYLIKKEILKTYG